MPAANDSVRHYLDQIGRVPLLDASSEVELARRIEAGSLARSRLDAGDASPEAWRAVHEADQAKDEFVCANLRLVVSIAKRYPVPPGMELLDLVQEGNVGLGRAVELFDWRKGFQFSTYASYWIRQSIGRSIDQHGGLIRSVSTPPLGEDSPETLGDLVDDSGSALEDTVVERLEHDRLLRLLEGLEPRRRLALELRMGLTDGGPRFFRDVGVELGVTPEAARRLVHRALDQLRIRAVALVAA